MINDKKFLAQVDKIPSRVIDYLDIFKETGNASAHSFFSINHQLVIEENRDRLEILLKQLTKIYKKLT